MKDETVEFAEVGTPGKRQEHLARLFSKHRDRLRRMVDLRFDPRLRSRADPSDVLQEAFLQASHRLEGYLKRPDMPFYLWLRFLVAQELLALRRKHVGARAARREVSLDRGGAPPATSEAIAEKLVAEGTSPSDALLKEERRLLIEETLEAMDEVDRKVLVLKHFEQLSNAEVAALLGITEAAVRQRHVRAVRRFRRTLKRRPGGADNTGP